MRKILFASNANWFRFSEWKQLNSKNSYKETLELEDMKSRNLQIPYVLLPISQHAETRLYLCIVDISIMDVSISLYPHQIYPH